LSAAAALKPLIAHGPIWRKQGIYEVALLPASSQLQQQKRGTSLLENWIDEAERRTWFLFAAPGARLFVPSVWAPSSFPSERLDHCRPQAGSQ